MNSNVDNQRWVENVTSETKKGRVHVGHALVDRST